MCNNMFQKQGERRLAHKPTDVNVVIVSDYKFKLVYALSNETIGIFKFCNLRDYMIEAKYANDVAKAYKKYLQSVMRGVVTDKEKGSTENKRTRCVPIGQDKFEIQLRKGETTIGHYRKHARAVFLQDASLNFDIMKAVETYLKRIEKFYYEEKKILEE